MPLFNSVSAISKLDTYNVKQLESALKVFDEKLKDKEITEPTRKKLEKMKKQYKDQITKTKGLFKKYSAKGKLPGFNASTTSVQQIYNKIGVTIVAGSVDTDTLFGKLKTNPLAASSIVVGAGIGFHALLKMPGVKSGLTTALKEVGKFLFGGSPAALGVWAGAFIIAPFVVGAIKKIRARNRALKLDIENAINKDTVYNIDNLGKNYEANKEKLIEDALTGGQKDDILAHLKDVAESSTNSPTERSNALKLIDEIKNAELKNKTNDAKLLINSEFKNKANNRALLTKYYAVAEKHQKEQEALNKYNEVKVYKTRFDAANIILNGNGSTIVGKDKEYQDAIDAYNNELTALGITDSSYKITDKDNPLKAGVVAQSASDFKDSRGKNKLTAGTPLESKYNNIISEFGGEIEVLKAGRNFIIKTSSGRYSTTKNKLSDAISELFNPGDHLKLDEFKKGAAPITDVQNHLKEYVTSKVIQAAMQSKTNDVTSKKSTYDTAKTTYDKAKADFDTYKEEIDARKTAHTDALTALNTEGINLYGSGWTNFTNIQTNTKTDVLKVLTDSNLFEPTKLTELSSKSLDEILIILKNFIPGKDALNKDELTKDSSLIK